MTMTAEQTTRIEKMETELHEQRQIFIQGRVESGRTLIQRSADSKVTENSCYDFISEMREIRGLLLRPRRASRESLPPNPVSDTL